MNNEELDSQLSAMFDDELPEPQCELLARRLARDEGLKARWGRYAVIAACIRTERVGEIATSAGAASAAGRQAATASGEARPARSETRLPLLRLNGDVAGRVSRAIAAEPSLLSGAGAGRSVRRLALAHPAFGQAIGRWWQPVAGGAVVAAGVAATAILWLRAGSPDAPIVAQNAVLATSANRTVATVAPLVKPSGVVLVAMRQARVASAAVPSQAAASPPDSFVVPPPARSSSFAPPIELANFVVAHSEYSMPLLRSSALSALVADEPVTDDAAENPPATADGSKAGATSQTPNAPHADSAH
ncbi:MAG: RseA family anti-sigma factor [Steroidobacteraceae bacterium]